MPLFVPEISVSLKQRATVWILTRGEDESNKHPGPLPSWSHHTRLNHTMQVAELGIEGLVNAKRGDEHKGRRGDLSWDESGVAFSVLRSKKIPL